MTRRHYDVVLLGRSLGTLACAVLLARRDFSVLLLGQNQLPPSYSYGRFRLRRRAFSMLFHATPVWKRFLHELAQTQTFRRHVEVQDPMFSILSGTRRVEVCAKDEDFQAEVEREFPQVRQLVNEFYQQLGNANRAIDEAFNRDVVWPPQGLRDKLDAARVSGALPLSGSGESDDALAKFPPQHPFRELATLPAVFTTDIDFAYMGLSSLAFSRLHGSWTRGLMTSTGGEDEVEAFLLERLHSHGGVAMLDRAAEAIQVKGNKVSGIIETGSEAVTGTEAVITNLSGEAVAALCNGLGVTKKALHDWPQVSPTAGRFTVSMIVRNEGLPASLGREAFLLPPEGPYPDPRRPVVHLQRFPAEHKDEAGGGESLLVAEILLPADGALTLLEARAAVLSTVRFHFPFIGLHLLILDSPHDGLPLEDYTTGQRREIDRIHVTQTSPKAEFMEYQWTVEPSSFHGLAGEPLTGPVEGTYLVGKTALPAIGQEGELTAAWSVARILTRKDGVRQKRRRQLWTKVET
jgi:hypothetical protein